jgi:hypothetical protein
VYIHRSAAFASYADNPGAVQTDEDSPPSPRYPSARPGGGSTSPAGAFSLSKMRTSYGCALTRNGAVCDRFGYRPRRRPPSSGWTTSGGAIEMRGSRLWCP